MVLSCFRAAVVVATLLLPLQSLAEEKPDVHAATRVQARAFEHGEGVSRNLAKAIALYCRAAAAGDAESQYSLGWIYANGRGVARDDAVSAYFFSLAAKQGHEHAERMLRRVGEPSGDVPACLRGMLETDIRGVVSDDDPAKQKIVEIVRRLAPDYGISPRLVLSVIRVESNFNPQALSSKNAQGLMQLIPETSSRFNVKNPYDPEQNIRGGLSYLRWLLAYFAGDVSLVAAAYNAGEGAVDRHAGIPPYPETRSYVKRVVELYRRKEHPFDASVVPSSPELPKIRQRAGARIRS